MGATATSERTGENILPFYIVCDESGSMAGNGGIDSINQGLPDLHATIASDPLVSDKCRIGLISFSDQAEVLMPLTKASEIAAMPGVTAKGLTNYGAAFALLKSVISIDIAALKASGYQVFRPAVFFISDGQSTDNWDNSYDQLIQGNPQAPNIISFGVDNADAMTMGRIGTVAAYIAGPSVQPGPALKEILRSLTNSIVSSSSSSVPQLIVPPPPDGCVAVPLQRM